MPSDATMTELPTGRSVSDADAGTAETAPKPMTRRELREAAAKREAAKVSAPVEDAADRVTAESDRHRDSDAFEAAAKALNFTGETAIAAPVEGPEAETPSDAVRRGARKRRMLTTAGASLSAMAAVGLLAVGLTLPLGAALGGTEATLTANAALATPVADEGDEEIQAFVAGDDTSAPALEGRIDDYEAASFADMADADGISTAGAFFTNDPTADIQWPFAVGTGMSYGYGMRSGRMHEGIDFTPGNGAPIQSIADGTVRVATESGGAYGVSVYIDHVIDGEVITSHYAHMQYGSLRVTAGQKVGVGDVIGLVGDTGRSFGAHAHIELLKGGATFDPLPWFEKYAGTHYSDEEKAESEGAAE